LLGLIYMMRFLFIVIAALWLFVTGCGIYTFTPKGKSDIKSVSVERFENETAEYGLEDRMTDQVIDALLAEGTLEVVEAEYADANLIGTLTRYTRGPYAFDEADVVGSYAVEMTFEISLRKTADDTEIWKESIMQKGIYNIETETEEDGRQRAIDLLIADIINKTTKSW
jgi:hypothetical protein